MKKTNALKITLIISIVILLTLISFVGIYVKRLNSYENIVPDYNLGMDLGSKRVITLKPSTETKSQIYDEDGKKVDSIPEDADESKYTTETTPVNSEDILTEKNYQNAKNIIEKRLKAIKAEGYTIRLDKSTGEIIVEFPENDNTSKYVNVLTATGRFEMVAEETEEVLLSNNDLKNTRVAYYNGEGGTSVYLTIELNKEGTKKLKDISNTYVDTVTKDEETGEETTVSKKAILRMDWPSNSGTLRYTDVITQSFSEEMANGTLQLKIGTASDNETLQNYYNQAFEIVSALNSGAAEIQYVQEGNEVLISEITNNQILTIVGVILAIFAIVSIMLIIKYKSLGILGTISNIGMISLSVLLIRLTKITVSITAIAAAVSVVVINTLIIVKLIKKVISSENKKSGIWSGILEAIDILLVFLAISVVFIFMYNEAIVSAGMIMFWGIISITVTNLLFTKPLLLAANKD